MPFHTSLLVGLQSPPRQPTEEELEVLTKEIIDEYHLGIGDPREVVPTLAVVWDFYTSDGPGYSGPVAIFVWGADEQTVTIFTTVATLTASEEGIPKTRKWIVSANYGPGMVWEGAARKPIIEALKDVIGQYE